MADAEESILSSQENTEGEATDNNGEAGDTGADESSTTNQDGANDGDTNTDQGANDGDQGDAGGDKDGDDKEGEEDERYGAPENYEFSLPEGVEDAEMLGSIAEVAKELNLSQAAAQKLVDAHFTSNTKAAEQLQETLVNQAKAWAGEVKKDPDLGGENFDTTLKHVALARDNVPGLSEAFGLFEQWGVQNHPDLVRAFAGLGKMFAEDSFKSSNNPPPENISPAKKLYPNLN